VTVFVGALQRVNSTLQQFDGRIECFATAGISTLRNLFGEEGLVLW
jgi:hypothetical protein